MPEIAALITVLIVERPLCVDCIAEKAQTSTVAVRSYLARINQSVGVIRAIDDRCRACGRVGNTFSVHRKE